MVEKWNWLFKPMKPIALRDSKYNIGGFHQRMRISITRHTKMD